jgi:hypothetical protein
MSAKAIHAVLTFVTGLAVGGVWLRVFWSAPRQVPIGVLAAPLAVGLVGLAHWVAYDFAVGHWAGDMSLLQACFNLIVVGLLVGRRLTPSAAP